MKHIFCLRLFILPLFSFTIISHQASLSSFLHNFFSFQLLKELPVFPKWLPWHCYHPMREDALLLCAERISFRTCLLLPLRSSSWGILPPSSLCLPRSASPKFTTLNLLPRFLSFPVISSSASLKFPFCLQFPISASLVIRTARIELLLCALNCLVSDKGSLLPWPLCISKQEDLLLGSALVQSSSLAVSNAPGVPLACTSHGAHSSAMMQQQILSTWEPMLADGFYLNFSIRGEGSQRAVIKLSGHGRLVSFRINPVTVERGKLG